MQYIEIILDVFIENDGDFTDIYINSCIHFVISKTRVVLADLEYRKTCQTGTNRMLMGALQYIIQQFPKIRTVDLNDVATKKYTKVFLTPKRLLLGKPGWYEERFGAKPSPTTAQLLRTIHKETPILRELIAKPSWGTNDDLRLISKNVLSLVNSSWEIDQKTIKSYPVEILVQEKENQSGGYYVNLYKVIQRKRKQYNNVFIEHQVKRWGS